MDNKRAHLASSARNPAVRANYAGRPRLQEAAANCAHNWYIPDVAPVMLGTCTRCGGERVFEPAQDYVTVSDLHDWSVLLW